MEIICYEEYETNPVNSHGSRMKFQIFFCKIHPVVAYHIKTDICSAVSHNKLYYSCQYMIHVSVTDHSQTFKYMILKHKTNFKERHPRYDC